MKQVAPIFLMTLALSACDNYEPREKTASYNPTTKQAILPHPCPDWSQSQTSNYGNYNHSNFGCAVNTNNALQVAEPADLERGHGDNSPNADVSNRTIQRYLAGEIPEPLTPLQDTANQ